MSATSRTRWTRRPPSAPPPDPRDPDKLVADWIRNAPLLSEHITLELAAVRHRGRPLLEGMPVPGCACVRCLTMVASGDELDIHDAEQAVEVLAGVHHEDRHEHARAMCEARVGREGQHWPSPAALVRLAGQVPGAVRPGERIEGCGCRTCTSPPSRRERDRLASRVEWDRLVERARAAPIGEVARRLGIEANRHGWAPCPFHEDSNPSLHVNERKGAAFCNPCGRSWDAIGLTMEMARMGFADAIWELARCA